MRQDGTTISESDPFSWAMWPASALNSSLDRRLHARSMLTQRLMGSTPTPSEGQKGAKFKSIVYLRRCFYPQLLLPDYAAHPMRMTQIAGVAIFAVGAVLLVFAYRSTNAPLEQISETITGRYSNQTMWYLVVGIAAVIGGALLAVFGNRK